MWALIDRTAFSSERNFVRDLEGRETWVVAVKARFEISASGALQPASDQEPPLLAPAYLEPGKSLRYEEDLILGKIATDVVLHGQAHAPGGKPTSMVDVRLQVGPVDKTIRVFGERHYAKTVGMLTITVPIPFVTLPLVYERAYGGKTPAGAAEVGEETRNPEGRGFATRSEDLVGQPLPNLEDPRNPIRSWRDRPQPMAFGPLARHWHPRLTFAGTYDDAWKKNRMPRLPNDFDLRFFQTVPEDQQVAGFLQGGEVCTLTNLTPGGTLTFALPKLRFVFRTKIGSQLIEHRSQLHTLILEPERNSLSMIYHTSLPCAGRECSLSATEILAKDYV